MNHRFLQQFFLTSALVATLLSVLVPTTFAQRQDVPARIALKDAGGATDVLLTGRRGNVIHARLGEQTAGSITYEAGDIRRMSLSLSQEAIRQAEAAAFAGNINEAVRRMRSVVQPIIPYLDLPVEGVVDAAFRYGELLRRERSWGTAISVYRALNGNPDAATRQQAVGWLAYCHMRNQEVQEARDIVKGFNVDDPGHAGFVPGTLALALLKMADRDDEGALDLAARASALARIDHELYPEAVFHAAGAYMRMSEHVTRQPDRKEVVLKKTSDVEVNLPAVSSEECREVASNLFTRLTQLFPSSPFAADAAIQIEIIRQMGENTSPPAATESGVTP